MPSPRSRQAAEARAWLIPVACGLLWGGAITAIETLRQPPAGLPVGRVVTFMLSVLLEWCFNGVCLALATRLAARNPSFARMAALWIFISVVLAAFQAATNFLPEPFDGGASMRALLGARLPLDAVFVHTLWQIAVCGGLYIAGYTTFQRALRSRRQLAWLQLALSEQAALLEEARLHALRGALQPEILLESVQALRTRYDLDSASADALLDRLVAYLRAATGSARRELSGEAPAPEAVQAYRALRKVLEDIPVRGGKSPIPEHLNDRNLT